LELIHSGRKERVYEFKGVGLDIGRDPGREICLEDARVSRHHARVVRRLDGAYYLIDLESKRSTRLDGRRIPPFEPTRLRDGSRIRIVDFELIFHDGVVEVSDREEDGATVLESLDDLSSARLARCSSRTAEALRAILEINRALGGGSDLNEMLGRALDGLMAVFPLAERGFILTVEPEGAPRFRAVRHRSGPARPPSMSRTILRHILQEGKAALIADTALDSRFGTSQSLTSTVRTALCVPLSGHDGRPIGMAQLDRRTGTEGFQAGDLDQLAALAVPIGVAVENHRLLQERTSWAAAREIQVALLPRHRPDLPGYVFWECYRPSLEVGGDVYDYIAVEPTGAGSEDRARWVITIGDVTGKGMPAALLAASIRPEVRHLARSGVEPEEVLTRVNRQVCDSGVDARFVTMALIELDGRTHRMTVVNAGHWDPLVRRAGGVIEAVGREGAGPPLGVDEHADYRPVSVALEPGDLVLLYTDGVTEAMDRDGQPFGEERLRQTLARAPRGAVAAGEAVLAAVRDHSPGPIQFDDMTIVGFGRRGD
jgi:serine phosphatase RsbU (regulator of sigma subunit)